MLSCAGAYVFGPFFGNECPAGSVRIEAEAACRAAVAAAGKTPGSNFVETDPEFPRGCYYTRTYNYAYFNTHAVGAGDSDSQLLCAALTTGAPSSRRRRTDARGACTGARACRHRACAARPSRAVCVIHGRHRDAHTYTNRYLYTYIYPYGADGARRRCRVAHGSAGGGGRAGTGKARNGTHRVLQHGYSTGVLIKGYSEGTQTGYSTGVLKRGLTSDARKGVLNRGTQKGYSKGVLKRCSQKGALDKRYSKGCSKRGIEKRCSIRIFKKSTQKGVLNNAAQKWVLKNAYSKSATQKGTQKGNGAAIRILKKGTHEYSTER